MVVQQDALLAQMRRGTLQYCVLSLLADEERYGFDLVRGLAERDGMVTSEGTIYPLLSRLRRDGLVESTWQESPSGPPRRYYRLTDAGRAALEGFKLEWRPFRDAVDHFVERKAPK
jgi:PadR family transcriptional regulator, regulatory protein PadR